MGGAAIYAQLDSVAHIAVDTSGIYIADAGNNRVRKINNSGIITTIAGTGAGGFSGDGGLATSASLDFPYGLAIRKNKLYIMDKRNHRIRKVDLGTGIITTICGTGATGNTGDGGPATAATMGDARILTIDTLDNIYFTDESFHVIRKVSTTGIITRICGNGTAGYGGDGGLATSAVINMPTGITVDDNFNIYFSDYYNHRVRKIAPNGIITSITGNGIAAFSGDGGGASSAQISSPIGISTDAKGNGIYFSDGGNNRIRVISNLPVPDICIATVDSLSKNNVVMWDKTTYFNIDSFIVYREVSSNPTLYSRIGVVPQAALSQFVDTNRFFYTQNTLPNGDPRISTYRYKIQMMDKDHNCSFLSKYHNTIYVNDISGNFIWNLYTVESSISPVSGYVLLRDNLSNGNWITVGTTSGSQGNLSDPNYLTYQGAADWRVEGLGFNCNPTAKQSDIYSGTVKSKSNIKNNKLIGIEEQSAFNGSILLYPNPATSQVIIEAAGLNGTFKIELYNSLGMLLSSNMYDQKKNVLNIAELPNGFYFVTIENGKQKETLKLIKN